MGQQKYEKKLKELGSRERVGRMLLQGMSPEEIAHELSFSAAKTNAEIRACYIKMNVSTRHKFSAIFFQELLAKDF